MDELPEKTVVDKKDSQQTISLVFRKRNWTQEKLNTAIYSDECKLDLHSRHQTYVRRPSGKSFNSKYILKTDKYLPNTMVWGAVRYF